MAPDGQRLRCKSATQKIGMSGRAGRWQEPINSARECGRRRFQFGAWGSAPKVVLQEMKNRLPRVDRCNHDGFPENKRNRGPRCAAKVGDEPLALRHPCACSASSAKLCLV